MITKFNILTNNFLNRFYLSYCDSKNNNRSDLKWFACSRTYNIIIFYTRVVFPCLGFHYDRESLICYVVSVFTEKTYRKIRHKKRVIVRTVGSKSQTSKHTHTHTHIIYILTLYFTVCECGGGTADKGVDDRYYGANNGCAFLVSNRCY